MCINRLLFDVGFSIPPSWFFEDALYTWVGLDDFFLLEKNDNNNIYADDRNNPAT